MKNIYSVLILIVLISTSAAGQENHDYIGLNSQYHKNDTTYTFNVKSKNSDYVIQKLSAYWGIPNLSTASEIMWSDKEIPNLNQGLIIHLSDKLCTKKKRFLECKTFNNEIDKSKKLKNIQSNQFRSINITISDKSKKNIIDNENTAKQLEQFLEEIIERN